MRLIANPVYREGETVGAGPSSGGCDGAGGERNAEDGSFPRMYPMN